MTEKVELHWGDFVTLAVYFVLVLVVGLLSSCRTNTGSVKGYFLAGRDMTWLPVGASIFATNIGSQFFIGMAGSAAANGLAVVIYEWHAVYILCLLGWFFVPVYVSSGAFTMPEYLKRRFGGKRLRILLSCLAIFLLIVQKISVSMYAGAVFIQQSVGWDMYSSIITITVVTAVYTIIGGLTAVIITDALQTVIMLGGSFYLMFAAFDEVGGMSGLFDKYMHSVPNVTQCGNETRGFPRADSLHIFRDPIESDIPWPGAIFGLTPMAILAWCTDQVMVQRALAAKTHSHAKGGVLFAGLLKLLPMVLIIMPGMISRVINPNTVGCVDPDICERFCQNRDGCSNVAYPRLVVDILPDGVRGLMLAVMLSALMSTMTSVFNSSSSMFTLDLWLRFRKRATQRELMIVGRIFIAILMVISIAWIPILDAAQGGQLWDYLQSMQAYLAPPWVVVFLLGIGWKRTTEKGAFYGLVIGLLVGMARLILHLSYSIPKCGEPETRPAILYKVHFLYFAIIVSGVTFIACVAISLFTEPRSEAKLRRVTWSTRHSDKPHEDSDDDEDFDNEAHRNEYIDPDNTRGDKMGLKQRVYQIVCCYSSTKIQNTTKEMEEMAVKIYQGYGESPWIKHTLNILAILLLTWTTFLIGFFG